MNNLFTYIRILKKMNEQEQSDNFKVMNLTDLPDRYFVTNEQKTNLMSLLDLEPDSFYIQKQRRTSRSIYNKQSSFEDNNETDDRDEEELQFSYPLNRQEFNRMIMQHKKSVTYKTVAAKMSSGNNEANNNAFRENRSAKNSPILNVWSRFFIIFIFFFTYLLAILYKLTQISITCNYIRLRIIHLNLY